MKRKIAKVLALVMMVTLIPVMEKNVDAATLSNPTKDSNGNTVWDCVWFGSYPQAEVIPSGEYTALESSLLQDGDLIVSDATYNKLQSATGWGENGDITIDGNKYRRIRKSDATYSGSSASSYYQWSDSIIYHYFKYEPIKWRVLNVNGNDAFLLADKGLDDQEYNKESTETIWETSTIRSWLNGYGTAWNAYGTDYRGSNFIETAFSSLQQSAIKITTVINNDNLSYGTDAGNNTNDKVFLLSESEVYTDSAASYGFDSSYSKYDEARRSMSSTYAKAMGTWSSTSTDYRGNCWWWLRSPGWYTDNATHVNSGGDVDRDGDAVSSDCAVRPALHLDLSSSNLYSYAGTVCSDGGMDEVCSNPWEEYLTTKKDDQEITTTEKETTKDVTKEETTSFLITEMSVNTKHPAHIRTAGIHDYFSFVPEYTGVYAFSSFGSYDTCGFLYDSNYSRLASDDDSGDGSNFRFLYRLTAGETYHLWVRMYNDTITGDFLCMVENVDDIVAPIEVLGAQILSQEGNVVTCTWMDTEEQRALGQTYNVYVDDDKINSEEFLSAVNLTLTFYASGEHTIRITTVLNGQETPGVTLRVTINPEDITNQEESTFTEEFNTSNSVTTSEIPQPTETTTPQEEMTISRTIMQENIFYSAAINEPGEIVYYKFVPTTSGKYAFSTFGSYDTYGYLYDSDMYQITGDDDSGDGSNCKIEYNFTAGVTYYFGVKMYYSGTTGKFVSSIKRADIETTTPEITTIPEEIATSAEWDTNMSTEVKSTTEEAIMTEERTTPIVTTSEVFTTPQVLTIRGEQTTKTLYQINGYPQQTTLNKVKDVGTKNSNMVVGNANKDQTKVSVKKATVSRVCYKNKKVSVTLAKMNSVSGYQVMWSCNKKFKRSKKVGTKKNKITINKFKNVSKKRKYYFKARAYISSNGKKYYGKWSKIRKIVVGTK